MTDKPLNIASVLQITPDSASTDNLMQNKSEMIEIPELIHIHDQLHDGIFMFRTDNFRFTYVNKGAQKQVGYTEAELLKMTPLDIKPEFTLKRFQEMVQPLRDGTQSLHIFHTIHRHKNGQDIPVEVVLQLMHHSSRESYFLAIVRDNTAYRNINKSLHERLKEMECLYAIRKIMLSEASTDETLQHVSEQLIEAMQFPKIATVKIECKGKTFVSTNYVQDTAHGLHAEIPDGNKGGRISLFYSENKLFLLPFEQNLINAIASDLQWWIERRQVQEKLQVSIIKQKENIEYALSVHASVIITDLHGTIIHVNDKVCTASKYSGEELLGQNPRMLNSGHHPQAFFRRLWKTISSGCIWKGEIKNRAKDGSLYWVDTTIIPFLDENKKPAQYIAIRSEITKRKRLEASLIQARDDAEKANRAKDSFLATMSHEIRTPLGALLGMLELLDYTSLDKDQRETLQAASDSGQSLLRILNDILDFSKLDVGKLELVPKDASIIELVTKVVNTYARVTSAKSLILTYSIDARISSLHVVDALRLSQVLNNFVSNALKFTSKGHIKVQVELLNRCNGNEELCFSVEDTGIGIAEEVQQHLFQDYNQSSVEVARMYGGTGLGLSICRRLIELMDGKIDLKSTPEQGSTFSVTLHLPVSTLAKRQDPDEQPCIMDTPLQPSYFSAARQTQSIEPVILVVDDHPINRKLMASQLKLLGLSCQTAENGQTALEMWRNGEFALIITDCHMPVMDGYQLTQTIRASEFKEKDLHIPILGWSANALPEEVKRCQIIGMDTLLTKPTNMLQLKEAMEMWLPSADNDRGNPALPEEHSTMNDAQTPIDSTVLAKFSLNAADKITVLQDFMEQTRSDFIELGATLEQQDLPACVHIAHRMKGASKMVGASELATTCEAMENAARSSTTTGAELAKAALDRALERLEVSLFQIK